MAVRVAVDIGGTFTDVVTFDEATAEIGVGKTLSTPGDLIEGIMTGFDAAGVTPREAASVIHGSTVVINALTERRGARVALVTTKGFRDIYEIGRINRPDAFNVNFRQHRPLVPREDVHEIVERVRGDGSVHRPLDEQSVLEVAEAIRSSGAEAIAICLLHAYRNPEHERRVAQLLAEACPGLYVTASHELSREYREFERSSTVVANAFVGPIVSDYLERLEGRLEESGSEAPLLIMQSGGGLADAGSIRARCVNMMESGPAGGVVGTIEVCRTLGLKDAIAFDMGGTTAKASVIRDLAFPQAAEYFIGGYNEGLPIQIPCLDIVEVGTGGGSIAWLDDAGGLHVGPRSAGASPGPACYGRGGEDATVTDAALVLGLLGDDEQLSGGLNLDPDAARDVIQRVGSQIGLDEERTATGILSIAAAAMANAVRAVTTERGLDPREFALFAYGGNGPLHISLVARELGITNVVIPQVPAVFSALGMLMADIRSEVVRTRVDRLDALTVEELDARFHELAEEATSSLGSTFGGATDTVAYVRVAEMRYVGQEHSIAVVVPALGGDVGLAPLKSAFDAAHLERFAHGAPDEPAEVVSLRLSAIRPVRRPESHRLAVGDAHPPEDARRGSRSMVLDSGGSRLTAPLYDRSRLLAGNVIDGPAAITEGTTTTLLRPGDRVEVDPFGNLMMTIGKNHA